MKKFFYQLFSDNNDINEKAIIGFGSFLMLVFAFLIDIVTGLMGIEFPIHQFIFDGFLIMTLGSFGIATVDKYINKTCDKDDH
jgi:hypothetical protein